MSDLMPLAKALFAGGALGGLFFGGLWWTVRKGMAAQHPALWFSASFLLRMGVTLAGFYFVAGAQWKRAIACLIGFVTARMVVTRLTRAAAGKGAPFPKEAGHAP